MHFVNNSEVAVYRHCCILNESNFEAQLAAISSLCKRVTCMLTHFIILR